MIYLSAVIATVLLIPIAIIYIMYLAYFYENLAEEIQELKDNIKYLIKKSN